MPAPDLDLESIEFLFRLLENPGLTISAADLFELAPDEGRALVRSGLLKEHGTASSITDRSDDNDVPVTLEYDSDRESFGYVGPAGWVDVPRELARLYRADLVTLSLLISSRLPAATRSTPTALIDNILVDVGDFQLTGSQLTSVWFARRCGEREIWDAVLRKAQERPSLRTRLILTGTRASQLSRVSAAGAIVLDCRNLLTEKTSLAADPARLQAALSGATVPDVTAPIWLSPDGRQLKFHGAGPIAFKTPAQIAVIRKLVEAYSRGERLAARPLLDETGSASRTFSQLFGRQKWESLSRFLKKSPAGWYFDL